jgi:hypothetical protein
MHHLILVREMEAQMSGCGRLEGAAMERYSADFPERRETMSRIGAIYRAARARFGNQLEITLLDPRNFIAFVPLVIRDAVRFGVPVGTALRALGSSSLATGVLDGQMIFSGIAPTPDEVIEMIESRLVIHRVGAEE